MKDRIINPFINVPNRPLKTVDNYGMDILRNLREINAGSGSKVLRFDKDGLWLGASRFADAPFSVDLLGQLIAKSATFKNESGTTIIDAEGIVSTANFVFDNVTSVQNSRTTSSTSFVDVPNTTLTFTLTRTTRMLFLLYADIGPASFNNLDMLRALIALDIDGTKYPDSGVGFGTVYNIIDTSDAGFTRARTAWHGHTVVDLAAGSHTAKLMLSVTSLDTVAAEIINSSVTYLKLGI